MRRIWIIFALACWFAGDAGLTLAQTSTARQRLGASRTTGSSLSEVGTVTGNERYVRGNRSANDFVGTSSRDLAGFVGMQQSAASSRVLPPVTTSRPITTRDANETARIPRSPIYDPHLTLSFRYTSPADQGRAAALSRRLQSCLAHRMTGQIEVSMEGRTATLQGVVASESDRALAQRMLLFEPGISQVRNELVVQAPAASPSPPPAVVAPSPPAAPEPALSVTDSASAARQPSAR